MERLKKTFNFSLSEFCDPYKSESCRRRVDVMKVRQDPCIFCLYRGSKDCLIKEKS